MTTETDATTVPPIEHREAMALAETAYGRFADVVEGLTDDDWGRTTDCEGWTVRDLVGHMVGAMRAAASMREQVSQQREIMQRLRRQGGNMVDHMTQVQVDRAVGLDTTALTTECRTLVSMRV
ncbi:MAG: maleylpyruvate isomerase family mycothiol-dependent enzyme, partial [Acidimicrobiales bacterium]